MKNSNEWDSYAPQYDNEPDHGLLDPLLKQKWTELINSQMPNEPIRVIDMGGGTGSITELLAEAGHQVTYVDSSLEMTKLAMKKCRKYGNQIDYFTCSVENLNSTIRDGKFDVIFGRHILWATENLPETLQTWHSLLSENGYFIFVEGFWSTGTGITSRDLVRAVEVEMGLATSFPLDDPLYWGKPINDERYLVISR